MKPTYYTVAELAAITKESTKTWRRRIASGEISVLQNGSHGSVRVSEQALADWIEQHTRVAEDPRERALKMYQLTRRRAA